MIRLVMRRSFRPLAAGLVAGLLLLTPGLAGSRWLHVRVIDGGDDGDTVKINLPLDTVQAMIPAFQQAIQQKYDEIKSDLLAQGIDLLAIRSSLATLPDSEFVSVEAKDGTVHVRKERGFLLVDVDGSDGEKVRIKVPTAVFEKLVVADPDTPIDLAGALEALADTMGEDLVQVIDGKSQVRIWIDDSETIE